MTGNLRLLLWVVLVVAGIGAMQWGASRAAGALERYRSRHGLRGVAAGALLGLATAAPEVSVNIASVSFGWPDLGLGAALGSNVPALPLVILLSWLSLRTAASPGAGQPAAGGAAPVVTHAAVPVQAVPYLLVVLLLGALTLPPGWAGLQPFDGLVLVAAWAVYLRHALRSPDKSKRSKPAPTPEAGASLGRAALLAVPAIALGALASVIAARQLGEAFGASDLVVGLFVIGLLCALPESFAAWRLAREGRTTMAVSAAMADGIVSLTIALVPPALAGATVGDVALYLANLAFLASVLVAYIALDRGREGQPLGPGRVALFGGGYAAYLAVMAFLLAR